MPRLVPAPVPRLNDRKTNKEDRSLPEKSANWVEQWLTAVIRSATRSNRWQGWNHPPHVALKVVGLRGTGLHSQLSGTYLLTTLLLREKPGTALNFISDQRTVVPSAKDGNQSGTGQGQRTIPYRARGGPKKERQRTDGTSLFGTSSKIEIAPPSALSPAIRHLCRLVVVFHIPAPCHRTSFLRLYPRAHSGSA